MIAGTWALVAGLEQYADHCASSVSFDLALVDIFDLILWLYAGLEVLAARSSTLEDHSPRQACRKTHGLSSSRSRHARQDMVL